MGIEQQEGGKQIWFVNRKEKQCFYGLESTFRYDFPKAEVISIKDYD